MNLEIFKRNVSLFKLGIADLDNNERLLYDFLSEELSDLLYFECNDPNILRFGKNKDKIVLIYIIKQKFLYVSYHQIWKQISDNMSMRYSDVQLLISWWLSDIFEVNPSSIDYYTNE